SAAWSAATSPSRPLAVAGNMQFAEAVQSRFSDITMPTARAEPREA
ncbi:hypothetical protein ACNVD4_14300, partial [Rhizobium sp. BR5]